MKESIMNDKKAPEEPTPDTQDGDVEAQNGGR